MGNKQPGPNSNMIIQIWGSGTGGKERRLTHRLEVGMIRNRWSTWGWGKKSNRTADTSFRSCTFERGFSCFHFVFWQTAENTEVVAVRDRGLGPMADGLRFASLAVWKPKIVHVTPGRKSGSEDGMNLWPRAFCTCSFDNDHQLNFPRALYLLLSLLPSLSHRNTLQLKLRILIWNCGGDFFPKHLSLLKS